MEYKIEIYMDDGTRTLIMKSVEDDVVEKIVTSVKTKTPPHTSFNLEDIANDLLSMAEWLKFQAEHANRE